RIFLAAPRRDATREAHSPSANEEGLHSVRDLLNDFKTFVLRGNVVDLAVGIVVGVAFGAVVSSFVKNLLTPLIGIVGKKDFGSLHFTIRKSTFFYGVFINDVVSFVLIAAA